ncbi:MAG TPA: hypothetical protein VGP55_08885 [Chitinophagaceae bacterium]|nr:hypothetical protein [Chitinophagaceae bacterium]
MATKIYTVAILLIIAMTTTFSTCKKGVLGCSETVYNFKINIKAYPDLDSIHIGDTIWLEVNTPTDLKDISSSKVVNYSGAANFGTAISFLKFTGGSINNPGAVYSANDFRYYIASGQQVNNPFVEGIREYLFVENNSLFKFKLAIIPNQNGIYSIGISDAANVYRKSDKCTKSYFEIDFANTNQHLYFLQNNRPGYLIEGSELTHLYCFKVY